MMNKKRRKALEQKIIDSVTKIIISVYETDFQRLSRDNPQFLHDWRKLEASYSEYMNCAFINDLKKECGMKNIEKLGLSEIFNPLIRIGLWKSSKIYSDDGAYFSSKDMNSIKKLEREFNLLKCGVEKQALPDDPYKELLYYWPKYQFDILATIFYLKYDVPTSYIEFKLKMISAHYVDAIDSHFISEDIHGKKTLIIRIDPRINDDILIDEFKELIRLHKPKYEINPNVDSFSYKKLPQKRVTVNRLKQIEMYQEFDRGRNVFDICRNCYIEKKDDETEERHINNCLRWGRYHIEKGKLHLKNEKLNDQEKKRMNDEKWRIISNIRNPISRQDTTGKTDITGFVIDDDN